MRTGTATVPGRRSSARGGSAAKNRFLLLLALPMVLFTLIFKYVPMAGVIVAFKQYQYNKGIFGSGWVGLANFRFLVESPDLVRLLRNTVGYNAAFLALNTICAVLLALLLYEMTGCRWLKTYQSILFFPHFLSWVVVAYMAYAFLNPVSGLLNQWLHGFGLSALDWYNRPAAWTFVFPLANLWKEIGMACMIYYAALLGIDPTYYEAARIDGAGRWQMMRLISIPFLYPIMMILIILAIGNIMDADFGLFYQLPMDSPTIRSTTDVLDTYIYRALINSGDIGMSSAAGLAKSVVGFALVIGANALVRRINAEHALF
ncbi:MAG: sugar ABC transporter permease [Paenibacillaceae bacterium]|nr:sugar ABC transporter permease [Paenibacillaceae bacterium]